MSVRVGAPVIRFSDRPDETARRVSLSADGKLLVLLLALTLLGPYLPLFQWLGLSEWTTREVRLDHFLLPALAAYVAVRSLAARRVHAPLHVVVYGLFLAWLALVTLFWIGRVPPAYDSAPGMATLVAGAEAYVRPLLVLFIAANARVGRHDLMLIVRLVFAVAIVLAVIAASQLILATSGPLNSFLAGLYDNAGDDQYFWAVLKGGRVASLMPQLSTLGMYMVLVLGILAPQLLRARLQDLRSLPLLLVAAAAMVAGILCGSKVFIAGLALTVGLGILMWPGVRRRKLRALGTVLAVGIGVWIFAATFFPQQAGLFVGRIPFIGGGIYEQYVAPRFEPGTGKVYRTGAMDIASSYAVTGLGLHVVDRTTDSQLLGILSMSGGVGAVLYVGAVGVVVWRLYAVSRAREDVDIADMARMMVVLSVVFLVAAVAFHALTQDRAGDAYWMIVGLLLGPLAARQHRAGSDENVTSERRAGRQAGSHLPAAPPV